MKLSNERLQQPVTDDGQQQTEAAEHQRREHS